MKPTPKNGLTPTPGYPARSQHDVSRRDFLNLVGRTALGVGLTALALPTLAEPAEAEPFDPKAFGKQIDDLAKLLGNEDFKKRREATAQLIALGKGDGTDTALDAKRRALVLEKMAVLRKAKDPEIAERARAVILALQPKVAAQPPEPPQQLDGLVVMPDE